MELSQRQVELIAGLSAGCCTTFVAHPLDLIKIRLQLSHGNASQLSSLLEVIQQIAKDGKSVYQAKRTYTPSIHIINQCYRGLVPNLLGNITAWGLYFRLYSEFKGLVQLNSDTANYFVSLALAGISTSVMTNPIWVLKTRILGTAKSEATAYSSIMDGIRKMLKTEGISSFWRGTLPSVFLVFQGSLQFTFYDHLKVWLGQNDKLGPLEYLYALIVSKMSSMLIMYPMQVIRARLQISHSKITIMEVVKQVWDERRIRGFYRGISANIVRVLPATTVTFVVYETVSDYLGKTEV